ncbi:MAG: DUF2284 domain-containing protein [Spirochaetes bacterium]|nr:DUF2284 domain-containing protein [Spirochaetota bacterium]
MKKENFKKLVLKNGAISTKIIDPKEVVTATWVRLKCQFGCEGYNSTLVCPPYSPEPETTRKMLDEYNTAILFQSTRLDTKKIAAKLERELFLSGYYKAFGMGAGPCRLCKEACSFTEGCQYPDEARPSMEACGIDVFATVRKFGYEIDTVKSYNGKAVYFGLVLIE